ncbi:MAG: N-acetylglucosamine-6-phosphate deacetylase [Victivallaceae bacterium]|nr:N-acetylglucosamine-6-phosphate deacetylase [Victivallaceae bacterium]
MNSKSRKLFLADYLLTPSQRIESGAVLCEGDKILAVGGESAFSEEDKIEVVRLPNAYVTPGFIDSHIHGAGGFDCSSVKTSINPIDAMSRLLVERGITAFMPTVVASAHKTMLDNISRLAAEITRELPGADALGINLEGPFINPAKRGAQDESAIVEVDLGFARELIAAGNGLVKIMTFAPELDNSTGLIELLLENHIRPSMGHSIADEPQTLRAIDAGANHCTHLFNGMQPLHQRDMGLAGIALLDPRVTIELIIDGRHVHPRMVDLACRCKALDKLIGISDCTMAAGMPNGEYRIGPSSITVRDGFSQTESGVLAGTTTMLDTGWHSLMSCGHLPDTLAAQAVTGNPAAVFGYSDRGLLRPGCRADLAFFERKTNRALMTVRQGEVVFKAEQK